MAFKMTPKSIALKATKSFEDKNSNSEPAYIERAEINSEVKSVAKQVTKDTKLKEVPGELANSVKKGFNNAKERAKNTIKNIGNTTVGEAANEALSLVVGRQVANLISKRPTSKSQKKSNIGQPTLDMIRSDMKSKKQKQFGQEKKALKKI